MGDMKPGQHRDLTKQTSLFREPVHAVRAEIRDLLHGMADDLMDDHAPPGDLQGTVQYTLSVLPLADIHDGLLPLLLWNLRRDLGAPDIDRRYHAEKLRVAATSLA